MTKKVIILGSGISGLFAAWACEQEGWQDFQIFTKVNLPPITSGFQYLHDPCDMELQKVSLVEKCIQADVPADMRAKLYSNKVYGRPGITNSLNKLTNTPKDIWDISQASNFLWGKYQSRIEPYNLDDFSKLNTLKADIIFWTIPLNLYSQQCDFVTSYVYSIPVKSPVNEVFYDISTNIPTYRFGVVFNQFFAESTQLSFTAAIPVKKVITFEGKLELKFPKNVVRIGRYGEWNKDVLAHDVYYKVRSVLNGKKI